MPMLCLLVIHGDISTYKKPFVHFFLYHVQASNLVKVVPRNRLGVGSQRHDIAVRTDFLRRLLQLLEDEKKVRREIVILLEQQQQTCVVPRDIELIKYPVQFPPPMVLHLCEYSLAVMTIQIGIVGVPAVLRERLLLREIALTVARIVTWKFARVRLYRERIKDLQHFAKADTLHQLVDLVVVVVVREDQQRLGNVSRMRET